MAESTPKTVWVVETGEYSNYHVVGVYTTERNAWQVARMHNVDEPTYSKRYRVAEWPLDPGIEELNAGLMAYDVLMLKDGTVYRLEMIGPPTMHCDSSLSLMAAHGKEYTAVVGVVLAKDKTHAVKIANEFRAQCIASGLL